MEFVKQSLEDILAALEPLRVDWQDDTARRVIERMQTFPIKADYTQQDLKVLLEENFQDGILICRLFMCLSKDAFQAELSALLGGNTAGVTRFQEDQESFTAAMAKLGVLDAITAEVNRQAVWSDRVIDRLRTMRGSAISGQKRGRGLEEKTEGVVQKVFGDQFDTRCTFAGMRDSTAKCDVAIPSRDAPRIVLEAKGYNATGSKMTDIIGDIDAIKRAKRPDTTFLFVTDGLTWKQRISDLRKIVERQNHGEITRIYTTSMFAQLEQDLRRLKQEHGI